MSKFRNRNRTALLVVDMQNGVVQKAHKRDEVLANIVTLTEQARKANSPVIWIQHSDENMKPNSHGWKLIAELKPESSETHIFKMYGDSFEDTNLESELERLGVGRVVVVGAQTEACIRATIHGAFTRGFDTTLASDAHTTEDLTSFGLPPPSTIIDFTNVYWTWQSAPERVASVEKTAAIQF
jgi:nicotinamidase-related amidase